LGDPIVRLKDYLIARAVWSEDRHVQAQAELDEEIRLAAKEAESYGTLGQGLAPSAREIFEGVFKEMPPHLRRQRQEMGV
jgi:2-oxoisovalerate dehydrogenase E1 component alpha subunit